MTGGRAKGRALVAPPRSLLRPTTERVREAAFDVLRSRLDLADASVIDLFAGTGAMGIEALSRGARAVTFVDHDPAAVRAIHANLELSRLELGGVRVEQSEVLGFLRAARAASTDEGPLFDLAFADPPYHYTSWEELAQFGPGSLVLWESAAPIPLGANYDECRVYRYGTTLLTVAEARPGVSWRDRL